LPTKVFYANPLCSPVLYPYKSHNIEIISANDKEIGRVGKGRELTTKDRKGSGSTSPPPCASSSSHRQCASYPSPLCSAVLYPYKRHDIEIRSANGKQIGRIGESEVAHHQGTAKGEDVRHCALPHRAAVSACSGHWHVRRSSVSLPSSSPISGPIPVWSSQCSALEGKVRTDENEG
jgi:hypothetical protein